MSLFNITTYTIPTSHLREYPRATTNGLTHPPALKLVINQYTPRSYTPSAGDLSIIFCHANGFHKELYEPFFDDLLEHLQQQHIGVRAIWAPDAVHQGASGLLNESLIGDQPSWNDFPRDVLHMVNTFAAQLPPPIVGIGHSYGGHAIIRASLMHPALFRSMIMIDPVIEDQTVFEGNGPAKASARRVDIWPSQADAEKYFRSRGFYKKWDPRCLELHLKHGLRELPSATYPNSTGVTLATTKHQEVYTFQRSVGPAGEEKLGDHQAPADTFRKLKEVVPPVLYIVGGDSPVSTPKANRRKMENTPNAEMITVPGVGHLVPLEKPVETAVIAASYLKKTVDQWKIDAEQDCNTPRQAHLPESFLRDLAKL